MLGFTFKDDGSMATVLQAALSAVLDSDVGCSISGVVSDSAMLFIEIDAHEISHVDEIVSLCLELRAPDGSFYFFSISVNLVAFRHDVRRKLIPTP